MSAIKVVLTGHSRGLGAAIAAELSGRGIPVLALARKRGADMQGVTQVALDLSDTAALSGWLAGGALEAFLSGADRALLINNAGMLQPVGPLSSHAPAEVAQCDRPERGRAADAGRRGGRDRRRGPQGSACLERSRAECVSGLGGLLRQQGSAGPPCPRRGAGPVAGTAHLSLAPGVIDTDMQAQIRATDVERFPLRDQFEALKANGALASPEDCAKRLLDFALSPAFGAAAVADLRDF